ncbi:MAG: type II toxin-antitoxin system VapC family toxin [Microbacteriaceae bacterium]|nr:type II toxin-antitoxin system VapC family toxin [Microbacteriaceae bacterium]
MKYLLDTDAVSLARKAEGSPFGDWIARQPIGDLAISAITLLELDIGVRRAERKDARGGARLRLWLDGAVIPMFEGRILPVDERVARAAAGMHVPDPAPDMDSLIAATALAYGLTLVTGNIKDMRRTGVALLDPSQM